MKRSLISLVSNTLIVSLLLSSCMNLREKDLSAFFPDEEAMRSSEPVNNIQEAITRSEAESDHPQLEIFSWWTGAGEEAGLKALIKVFKEKYPGIYVFNAAVEGGAGGNAKEVLERRMKEGEPPDTFQGRNMLWAAEGRVEPLNDLYKEEGWYTVFPPEIIDMLSLGDDIYYVPLNIHRQNVLWYNKSIFADNNLQVPSTFDEFFKVADQLQRKGITPLAFGNKEPWMVSALYTNVMLGTLGAEDYKKLSKGEINTDDPHVKEGMERFAKMLTYVNADHAERNWQDAAKLVAEGKAAMNIMGDWVNGFFTHDLKLKDGVQFGWNASPGTEGIFRFQLDAFGLSRGAEDRESVRDWLRVLGSAEGQNAFNPLKGSIPARQDVSISNYDSYSRQAMEAFRNSAKNKELVSDSRLPASLEAEAFKKAKELQSNP
ncbi:ABC transporter substrate-binding protein [Paenibacillus sp. FSL F4-0236]|uniref:ABC transporter substrate-binding protein n=1 Tax=Paenibacillus sp. FSL F4-0236 TaxID=2954731 RepID=UPI0030F785D0